MSNKVYNTLKWVVSIALPAFITLYVTLAQVWEWANTDKVIITLGAVSTFIGVLIGLSSRQYSKEVENLFSSSESFDEV
jgi:hypothetical protein